MFELYKYITYYHVFETVTEHKKDMQKYIYRNNNRETNKDLQSR